MRVHKIKNTTHLEFYTVDLTKELALPYFEDGISAGFPSPSEDHIESSIDLNKELIDHPSSTFFVKVKGFSLKDIGIFSGDLLVVDKSISPENGKVYVCSVNREFTVKILKIEKNTCWLLPANKKYKPIEITQETDFVVWGRVNHAIKSFKNVCFS